jgi:SAM-dependent methyltransferase
VKYDLAAQEYLRERIEPKPGDFDYLHLSDLLIAIKKFIPPGRSRVLDYGCGGSPYRSLFGNCTYHLADMTGGGELDFEYGPDSRLPCEANSYDCVLSTQVLEHVDSPAAYLRECYRVLIPGGHLLLTTHGTYKDHACPHDYWRWTVFGLDQIVREAGFRISELKKVTVGPRAALYLLEGQLPALNFHGAGMYSQLLSFGVRAVRLLGTRRLHEAIDKSFPSYRVAGANEFGEGIYICMAVLASR